MDDKPQTVSLRYYGISPWEIEVIYNIFNEKFEVIQDVTERHEYLQHLFGQRTPVIYEIENMLKKYEIEYRVWNSRVKKYVQTVFDNYKIKLMAPNLPVFAWKPMLFVISTVSLMYLWKYLDTIF